MQRRFSLLACLAVAASLASVPVLAAVEAITVPKGLDVPLVFDEGFSSKTAKVGQTVKMHVSEDVKVGDKTVIPAGTSATGVISKVEKRKHFGVNAKMQITLNPIKAVTGDSIPLEPKDKGKYTGGTTDKAAAASGGGALLLGPIGLVGGYFVVGKSVNIKPGDRLVSSVSEDVALATK